MPIRFRCSHCDQLMGIARRKTGITVKCPRCHESVVVPLPDLRQASHVRRTVEVNQPRFERKDFDEIFAAALAKGQAENPKSEIRNPKAAVAGTPTQNPKSEVRNPQAVLAEAPAPPRRPAPLVAAPQLASASAAMAETTVDAASMPAARLVAEPFAPHLPLSAPRVSGVTRLAAIGIAVFCVFAGVLLGLALR